MTRLLVVLALVVAACTTPWRMSYLQGGVGQLTQDSVIARLGPPTSERVLSDSSVVWRYEYKDAGVVGVNGTVVGSSDCHEYILQFDRARVLRQATRQKC